MSQCYLLASRARTVVLHNFEMNVCFLEMVGLIDCESYGDCAGVIPIYFVLFYWGAIGASAVLGGGGGGEMPFHVGCAGDKWYIVEIKYLP
jgi:hypothetical protein